MNDATTQAGESEGVAFNLFDPSWRANPYPLFRQLRKQAPAGRVPMIGIRYLTRFRDCELILRHPAMSVDSSNSPLYRELAEAGALRLPDAVTESRSFLFLDPPDHTRLRGLVAHAFTPRTTARLKPWIERRVVELLDVAAERGRLEVLEDLAYPVALGTICAILGIPAADQRRIRAWSKDMAGSNDPIITPPPETVQRQETAVRESSDYLLSLIRARRSDPGDDLVSAMLAVEADGDRLTEAEILSTVLLLLAAGFEATASLIGNGVLALLENPDELALLRADPGLVRGAVEEVLRWDPPVQMTQRIALEQIDLGDITLTPGEPVLIVLAAANRDEERFADGERFDVTRGENRHLAFSFGAHFCLGASLGRIEAATALGMLAQRFPNVRCDGEIRRRSDLVMRGLEALPVAL